MLVFAAALALLASGLGNRLFVRPILGLLHGALAGTIELRGATVYPDGFFRLRGIEIRDPDGHLVASAERLDGRLSLGSLLARHVVLTEVRADGVELDLAISPKGLGLARAFEPRRRATASNEPLGTSWRVDVELRSGAVRRFGLRLQPLAPPAVQLEEMIAQGRLRLGDDGVSIEAGASGRATLPVEGPLAASAKLHFARGRADGAGRVSLGGASASGDWDLALGGSVDGRVDLRAATLDRSLLTQLIPGSGLNRVELSAHATAHRGDWSVAVALPAGKGALAIDATADPITGDGQAHLVGRAADPRAFSESWPQGALDFDLDVRVRSLWADVRSRAADPRGGDGQPPRHITAKLTLRRSSLGGEPVGPGTAAFEIVGRRLLLDGLALAIPGGALRGEGRLGLRHSALSLELLVSDLAAMRRSAAVIAGAPLPELLGYGEARLDVTGPLAHPALDAQISFDSLALGGIAAQGVRGRLVTPRLGRPIDLEGLLTAESVEAGGRSLRAVRAEGTWRGSRLSLTAGEQTRHGESSLRAELTIPKDLRSAALAELALETPSGNWALESPARASFAGGLSLRDMVLRSGPQRISVDGGLPSDGGLWLHVKLDSLDLSALPRDLVPGHYGLSGHLQGELSYQEPKGKEGKVHALTDIRLQLVDGGARGVSVPQLNLELRSDKQGLHGKLGARIASGTAPGTIEGQLRWPLTGASPSTPLAGALAVKGLSLDLLAKLWPSLSGLHGMMSVDANAGGDLRAPDVSLAASIQGLIRDGPAGPSQPVDVASHLALRAAGLDVDVLATRQRRVLAKAAAGARLDGGRLIRAVSRPTELVALLRSAPMALDGSVGWVELAEVDRELGLRAEVAGETSGELHLQGELLHPRGSAELHVVGLAVAGRSIGEGALQLAADDRSTRLHAELTGAHAPERKADGTLEVGLPLERLTDARALRSAPLSGRATYSGWPLALLWPPRRLEAPPIDGVAGGEVTLAGSLAVPELRGQAHVPELRVRGESEGSADSTLSWDGQVAQVALSLREPHGGALEAAARIPAVAGASGAEPPVRIDPNGALSGTMRAHAFDLSFLSALGEPIGAAQGTLEANLALAGTLRSPVGTGTVDLSNGELALVGLGEYRKLTAHLRLAPQAIWIDALSGTSGEGTLVAKGEIDRTAEGAHLFSGQAETRNFALWTGDAVRGHLTSKLALAGHFSLAGIDMEIRALSAHLQLPDEQARELEPLSLPTDIVILGHESHSSGAGLPLDVHLVAPGPVVVTGSDLSATGKADLWAHVAADDVRLRGRIDVSKGSLELFGRTFEIERAVLGYGPKDGPGRPPDDPRLSATATQKTAVAKVFVVVTGSLKEPELDLHSEPPLSESQISSLLATGTLPTAAGQNPGAGQGGIEASGVAASVAGAFLASTLKGAIGHYLPLDVLTLDPTHAEIGEHLGSRLYLGYVQNFGVVDPRVNTNEIRAQYQLDRDFSLDSTYGDAGAGELNLEWTHDW
ncbi:MAG: translocation/assembly module TamB domain-containing protein [Deltaproteobacteria bacterium]